MQITYDNSGLRSGLAVATDKSGRDHCVVVVKGTFQVAPDGRVRPAEVQRALVFADEHHGEPGSTSVRHECDFALFKPFTDVVVHGHAMSARPVARTLLRLELAGRRKELLVSGDRRWERGAAGPVAGPTRPFTRVPLVYERAFGGTDERHGGCERRNPVGVGFRSNARAQDAIDTPLPNIEDPRHPIAAWTDRPPPIGCGVVARGWLPRVTFAGTYDQRWLDERAPFLPEDFDPRHFQAAPGDQQVPHVRGGELLKVEGVRESGPWVAEIPRVPLSVKFRFRDRDVVTTPLLDTVLLDCDAGELVLTWRTAAPLGKKLVALREIEVLGAGTRPGRLTRGKPHFAGLSACLAWLKTQRGAR